MVSYTDPGLSHDKLENVASADHHNKFDYSIVSSGSFSGSTGDKYSGRTYNENNTLKVDIYNWTADTSTVVYTQGGHDIDGANDRFVIAVFVEHVGDVNYAVFQL